MINFSTLQGLTVPKGVVTKIEKDGVVLWKLQTNKLVEDVAVGEYIAYSANGYSSWRVLFNNNGQLDLVSAGSVKDVTLSGNSGYCNAVQILNNEASAYVTGIATSGRSIGCTSASQATVTVGDTQASLSSFPFTDTLYTTDFNQIVNNGLVQSDKDVWLASRVESNRKSILGQLVSSNGSVRTITTSGTLDYWSLQTYSKAGWSNDKSHTYGLRPVISLPSGLKVVSGDGTASNPYVLTN